MHMHIIIYNYSVYIYPLYTLDTYYIYVTWCILFGARNYCISTSFDPSLKGLAQQRDRVRQQMEAVREDLEKKLNLAGALLCRIRLYVSEDAPKLHRISHVSICISKRMHGYVMVFCICDGCGYVMFLYM